jgi:hypothetical protein
LLPQLPRVDLRGRGLAFGVGTAAPPVGDGPEVPVLGLVLGQELAQQIVLAEGVYVGSWGGLRQERGDEYRERASIMSRSQLRLTGRVSLRAGLRQVVHSLIEQGQAVHFGRGMIKRRLLRPAQQRAKVLVALFIKERQQFIAGGPSCHRNVRNGAADDSASVVVRSHGSEASDPSAGCRIETLTTSGRIAPCMSAGLTRLGLPTAGPNRVTEGTARLAADPSRRVSVNLHQCS